MFHRNGSGASSTRRDFCERPVFSLLPRRDKGQEFERALLDLIGEIAAPAEPQTEPRPRSQGRRRLRGVGPPLFRHSSCDLRSACRFVADPEPCRPGFIVPIVIDPSRLIDCEWFRGEIAAITRYAAAAPRRAGADPQRPRNAPLPLTTTPRPAQIST